MHWMHRRVNACRGRERRDITDVEDGEKRRNIKEGKK